jgi:TRAP-type C4-dicarboxylate transport system substrate-binding protein
MKFSMTLAIGVVVRRIIRVMKMWCLVSLIVLALVGCSSAPANKQAQPAASAPAVAKSSNPVARYIELVGFRVAEKSAGHLQVQFGVVNHSEADVGDIKMNVNLRTSAAKAGDPPLVTFSAKVPAVGPGELKQVTVDVPSTLRVYELPDWQFLKADFEITEPK